jgi:uncharacterized protein with von Willebrand factor type A (vWA) domain
MPFEFRYTHRDPSRDGGARSVFDELLDLFQRLLQHTAGDAREALEWMTRLDGEYGLTDDTMGIGDFVEELRRRGLIEDDEAGTPRITPRTVRALRRRSLEEVFSRLRRGPAGGHRTAREGEGGEALPESRPFRPGDDVGRLDAAGTLHRALRRSGPDELSLTEDDLQVFETDHRTSTATVLMIDCSHSMVLYGEDRITPARTTAMALAELILTRYPKDTLDLVAFGTDAWPITIDELPFLEVGPWYTNTLAGLQRARDLLRRRRNRNRQILMITDGKPSCHYEAGRLYRNPYGLDRRIVNRVLDEAVVCRREGITISTFMVARDAYLQNFVRELTAENRGRAYYARPDDLGAYLFEDFVRNRSRHVR